MDVAEARRVLGLGPTPSWVEVRVAYRAEIGAAHPDRAGGSNARAALVNHAYATLEAADREGALHDQVHDHARDHPPPPASPRSHRSRVEVLDPAEPPEVLDGDTVRLALPPDEAFACLLEACHTLGDVTYIDRSCAILEALVRIEGDGVCSLVITLQGQAAGTDAFCTLEAIERVAAPPVRPVVEALVELLRAG